MDSRSQFVTAAVVCVHGAHVHGGLDAQGVAIVPAHLAIIEGAIRGLRPRWQHWLLGDNLMVVITNQPQNFPLVNRSTVGVATLLACYTLALVAVAVASFRRRDIT